MSSEEASDTNVLHLLLVVAQAARGEELRRRLASLSRGRPLELLILAPAFVSSALQYIASDVDEGIRKARGRLEHSLREIGSDRQLRAVGEVGEADPLMAIDSALAAFPADEIVIVPSPKRGLWAEKKLFEHACKRFDLPVREIELEEDSIGTRAVQASSGLTAGVSLARDLGTASAQRQMIAGVTRDESALG